MLGRSKCFRNVRGIPYPLECLSTPSHSGTPRQVLTLAVDETSSGAARGCAGCELRRVKCLNADRHPPPPPSFSNPPSPLPSLFCLLPLSHWSPPRPRVLIFLLLPVCLPVSLVFCVSCVLRACLPLMVVGGSDLCRVGTTQPDEYSYRAAIVACSGANQWERALGLFRRFQRAAPGGSTGRGGPLGGGAALPRAATGAATAAAKVAAVPGTATYNAVITACARGLFTEEALEFFLEMAERGVPQDEVRRAWHLEIHLYHTARWPLIGRVLGRCMHQW